MQNCSIKMDCSLLDLETCVPLPKGHYDMLPDVSQEEVYANLYSEDGCYNSTLWIKTQAFKNYEIFLTHIGFLTLLTGTPGIVANLFNIVVLARSEMANRFSQLLIAINICDSIQLLCAVLDSIRNYYPHYYPTELLHAYPFLQYPALRISMTATIYLIIGVAIERYIAVCRPHHFRESNQGRDYSSLKYIVPSILLAFLVNSSRFLETVVQEHCYDVSHCGCGDVIKPLNGLRQTHMTTVLPTEMRVHRDYILYYGSWGWTIATGMVPFALLVVLNTTIYLAVKKLQNRISEYRIRYDNQSGGQTVTIEMNLHAAVIEQAERSRQRRIKQQNKECHLTVVLLTTVVAFLICHLPRILTSVYEAVQMSKTLECRKKHLDAVEIGFLFPLALTQYLMVFNASSNLPIYMVTCEPFRKAIVQMAQSFTKWPRLTAGVKNMVEKVTPMCFKPSTSNSQEAFELNTLSQTPREESLGNQD